MNTANTSTPPLQLFAENIDTQQVQQEILEAARKRHPSAKLPYETLQAGRMQTPDSFDSNSAFLQQFLAVMRDNTFVDIGDFEIVERRRYGGRILIAFKRAIWSLLRFYTYRLWSQQNEINGFMLAAIEAMNETSKERQSELETRIAVLERRVQEDRATHPPAADAAPSAEQTL